MAIKNHTYRNHMIVLNRIMKKGYSFGEADVLTRNVFSNYGDGNGLSIEALTDRIITREEYINAYSAPADEAMPEDATPIWGEELTAEERDLVEEYMDASEADHLSVREAGAGTWEIEEDGEVLCFDTAKDLMEHITSALRDLCEAKAEALSECPEELTFFYQYSEDDLGCDEQVIAAYDPCIKMVGITALEKNADGFFVYYADIAADMFTVSNKSRLCQLLLDNTDQGTSCGAYATLRDVINDIGDPMLYFFRPADWAGQLKQMRIRGC